jgi:hypothetical protein
MSLTLNSQLSNLPQQHDFISNHFYTGERGGTGADAQGIAIADPR